MLSRYIEIVRVCWSMLDSSSESVFPGVKRCRLKPLKPAGAGSWASKARKTPSMPSFSSRCLEAQATAMTWRCYLSVYSVCI